MCALFTLALSTKFTQCSNIRFILLVGSGGIHNRFAFQKPCSVFCFAGVKYILQPHQIPCIVQQPHLVHYQSCWSCSQKRQIAFPLHCNFRTPNQVHLQTACLIAKFCRKICTFFEATCTLQKVMSCVHCTKPRGQKRTTQHVVPAVQGHLVS